nr:MAG TPA: hypothetical protein [Caudoviricetes sp.]DAN76676.1 MAG TPA: hypothetical protein [Caudoviricetes sp.]
MYITSYTFCVKPAKNTLGRYLTQNSIIYKPLTRTLMQSIRLLYSRVRWQFPSPRKLHKLLCSCFCLSLL